MNSYVVLPRLVILFIAFLTLFIIYTGYLVRKYGFLNDNRKEITQAYTEHYNIYKSDKYYTKRELHQWLNKYEQYKRTIESYRNQVEKLTSLQTKIELLKLLTTSYVNVFLLPQEYAQTIDCMYNLYNRGEEIINDRNEAYIEKELKKYDAIFSNISGNNLNDRQRRAIITDEANSLFMASVDTEKTITIAGKISYILEKKYATPEEILIISSTDEARQKLKEQVNENIDSKIKVHTFQSLGNEIIEKTGEKLPSLHITAENEAELSTTIEGFIQAHMNDFLLTNKVNQFLSYYLLPVEKRLSFKTSQEYETYLRNIKPRTIKGENVKSLAEFTLANYLYFSGIPYVYEQPYIFKPADREHTQYTANFYLPHHNIWIEHLDIDRNCNPTFGITREEYLDSWYSKRKIHREHHTELVETYSYQLNDGTLIDSLTEMLQVRGVRFIPISKNNLFNRFQHFSDFSSFVDLLSKFLRLYKSGSLSIEQMEDKVKKRVMEKKYSLFLEIFKIIHLDYEAMLTETDCIDLDDMINYTIQIVSHGKYTNNYKYIVIDEFQNISESCHRLLNVLLAQNLAIKTFFVKDSTQSTHGLMGSYVSLITEFKEYFNSSQQMLFDEISMPDDELISHA